MTKKVITPSNESSGLTVKLQKEVARLEKKVLSLENEVLKAQNKYLKLEQRYLVLDAKSKKPNPIDPVDLSKYLGGEVTKQPTPREYADAVEAAFKKDKP